MLSDEQRIMEDLNNRPHPEGMGLGRLIVDDDRDQRFGLRRMMSGVTPDHTERYWFTNGWWGNQGNTNQCVGYSWTHWLDAGPTRQPVLSEQNPDKRPIDPTWLYNEAQKVDQWPGEDYEGTSVRGAAKILKQHGLITSYRWAWDLDTVVKSLLTLGPMVVGTWWYSGMYQPDQDTGLISVNGSQDGGHAYLLTGVDTNMEVIQVKNSWGRSWGKNGYGYIRFKDMERLIKEHGECCIAFEKEVDSPLDI